MPIRLLLFSDIHCDRGACERLVAAADDVDVVIGAGDFCNMRRDLETPIGLLRQIEKPTILVPGNAESYEELRDACQVWPLAYVLHGSQTTIGGLAFYGIGGGIPVTPFGSWSYDFTEEQASELLVECPTNCVLVTHSPPKGVLDASTTGENLGSESVRAAVIEKHPQLVVCGHIHGCSGRADRLGASTVVNAGPRGMSWEL